MTFHITEKTESIAKKVSREYVLRKVGIDLRTDAEKRKELQERKRAIAVWDKTGGFVNHE